MGRLGDCELHLWQEIFWRASVFVFPGLGQTGGGLHLSVTMSRNIAIYDLLQVGSDTAFSWRLILKLQQLNI